MFPITLLIASLSVVVLGAPAAYYLKLHDSRADVPTSSSHIGVSPASDAPLQLCIAFVQNNFTTLEEPGRLCDSSRQSSATYVKHHFKKEINELLDSRSDSHGNSHLTGSILVWVDTAGLNNKDADAKGVALLSDWMDSSLSFNDANSSELVNASFPVFKDDESGPHAIRTLSYSNPAKLEDRLDFVYLTISFPDPSPHLISDNHDNHDRGLRLEGSAPLASGRRLRHPPCVRDTHPEAFDASVIPNGDAHSANCAIVIDAKTVHVDDAGCAGTTVTAIVVLLNGHLIAAGRHPLLDGPVPVLLGCLHGHPGGPESRL